LAPRKRQTPEAGTTGLQSNLKDDGKLQKQLSRSIDENESLLRDSFGDSMDLSIRRLRTGDSRQHELLIVHLQGLVDDWLVSNSIIQKATQLGREIRDEQQAFQVLRDSLLTVTQVEVVTGAYELVTRIAAGNCGLLVNGIAAGLCCIVPGGERRAVDDPINEPVVRGPREGFTESLHVNISLLRRRIKDSNLRFEQQQIGRISKTEIAVAYITGTADERIVREVRQRLARIDIDFVQESGQIEELIEDSPFSIFPSVFRTERPDRVAQALAEGRVAVLTDGSPFVLLVPSDISMFLASAEDYYERFYIASFIRLLRIITFFISLTLPSLYVAVLTFHHEMLPTELLFSIAAQRDGIPFPAIVEALLMELVFEVLREAGVRLPRIIGPAVSIVGALVLGEAAIRAGLVSPAMVMVVALTAVASFATPAYSLGITARLLRFPLIILAASLGLFGVMVGLYLMYVKLTAQRSFGVPYLTPVAPVVIEGWKDSVIRAPLWMLNRRPSLVANRDNLLKQKPGNKPQPPDVNKRQQ
jgi:spore germination protein KA